MDCSVRAVQAYGQCLHRVPLQPLVHDLPAAAIAAKQSSRNWEERTPSGKLKRLNSKGDGDIKYAMFCNDAGGILDDLMVTHAGDRLFVVVNAACKDADTRHLVTHLGHRCQIVPLPDRALLALQGAAQGVAQGMVQGDAAAS